MPSRKATVLTILGLANSAFRSNRNKNSAGGQGSAGISSKAEQATWTTFRMPRTIIEIRVCTVPQTESILPLE